MKHFFNINQQLRKCEGLLLSVRLWLSVSLLSLSPPVKRKLFSLLAHVSTGMIAFRTARRTNHRLYIGLVLCACGPLVENFYRLLEWAIVPGAYQDPYYYFHCVRGNLSAIMYAVGFFVAMPID